MLVTTERESFGLAVLEALACGVPVASTPVGVAPEALAGVERDAVRAVRARRGGRHWVAELTGADEDRASRDGPAAEPFSADRMADRVVAAWRTAG